MIGCCSKQQYLIGNRAGVGGGWIAKKACCRIYPKAVALFVSEIMCFVYYYQIEIGLTLFAQVHDFVAQQLCHRLIALFL